MTDKDLKTEIELLKKDIDLIKNNHLAHMQRDIDVLKCDVRDVKRAIFKAQYVIYGAIVVLVLKSDKFNDILKLL